jgi:hypothetical protein
MENTGMIFALLCRLRGKFQIEQMFSNEMIEICPFACNNRMNSDSNIQGSSTEKTVPLSPPSNSQIKTRIAV